MSGMRKSSGINIPDRGKRGSAKNINVPSGTYVASVVDNSDANHTGRILVKLGEHGSMKDDPTTYTALLMTPMGGSSGVGDISDDESDENTTTESFGMWPQPPAVGTSVVVTFDPTMEQPILMGSLITAHTNHNMGGNASAENKDGTIGPVAEKNSHDTSDPNSKPTRVEKTEKLESQGLDEDYTRGHSMSSARRESPSKVFGMTTAGGHTLSMDDGNEGDSQGIRIRTNGGAQILMDDKHGFIFITNQKGNVFIEINNEGNVDIHSTNSFSVASDADINFHAKGDFNVHAEGDINMKSDVDYKLEAGGNTNVSSKHHKETSNRIDMNTGGQVAEKPNLNSLPENGAVTKSVASRVPEKMPWNGITSVQETFTTSKGKDEV
jgi:hypothetical protein